MSAGPPRAGASAASSGGPTGLDLEVEASPEGIAAALPGLRHHLDTAGAAPHAAERVELVVEEIVMNVALHSGLPERERRVALRAEAGPDGGCSLVFEDRGRPFDPAAAPLPDPAVRLASGAAGGLGLVLVRRFAAAMEYARLPDGRNRLRVVVRGGE